MTSPRWLALRAKVLPLLAVVALSLTAGCGDPLPPVDCTVDAECSGGRLCVSGVCILLPDLSTPPLDLRAPDLSVPLDLGPPPPDLTPPPPDLTQDAGCAPGQRLCGNRCIPVGGCCVNADCPATGQVCQNDNTCACAVGLKVCLGSCVPLANCCVDADCVGAACSGGMCIAASCNDGIKNGLEVDVDCGGPCVKCAVGASCNAAADCGSGTCTNNKCAASSGWKAQTYGGASQPSHLVAADFDGDKRLDVVTANTGSGNVSVLLGRGDGTFDIVGHFPAGLAPAWLAVGDWNGDKRLDLVSLDRNNRTLAFLGGTGGGAFSPPVFTALGAQPANVVSGDFDEDGKLDVAVGMAGNGRVLVLPGKGNGSFDAPLVVPADGLVAMVTTADFDGDTHLDLATANSTGNSVSVAFGRGNGQFGSLVSFKLPNPGRTITSADFDGDGALDLVVGTNGFSPLRGIGMRAFQVQPVVGQGLFTIAASADLDGNKLPELLGPTGFYVGSANFAFSAAVPYGVGVIGWAVAGDFTGDGKQDVAMTVPSSNSVAVVFGNGDGTVKGFDPKKGSGSQTVLSALRLAGVAIADWNGDTIADVLLPGQTDESINFFYGDKGGPLLPPTNFISVGKSPRLPVMGDWNGDALLDMAIASSGDTRFSVVLAGRAGNIMSAGSYDSGGLIMPHLAAGDTNGDGKLDLVGLTTIGTVLSLVGKGNGSFAPAVSYNGTGNPVALALADVDGDKKLDAVLAGSFSLAIVPGNGDGTFGAPKPVVLPGNLRPSALAVGDLDGDGKNDLAVTNSLAGSEVYVFLGKAAFANPQPFPAGRTPAAVVLADLDRDGKLDVATANSGDATASILLGNGDGTLKAAYQLPAGPFPGAIAAGDLDGDKKIDLAVVNASASTFTVFTNGL